MYGKWAWLSTAELDFEAKLRWRPDLAMLQRR